MFSHIILINCLLITFPAQAYSTKESIQKADKKHILVLNSYNKGYRWTDNEVQGIEDAFAKEKNTILHIEYMDTKIKNDDGYFSLLRELYKNKYQQFKFDAIISTDDDALKFLRRYRSDLFPGVPVIFCGINSFTLNKVEGFDNYTGVNEEADYIANIELILKLHPQIERIYIINDNLTTGKSLKKIFDQALNNYKRHINPIYLSDLSMSMLKQKVAKLEKDSVIFYLSFFRDKKGVAYTPIEAIPQIASVASVPMYGSVDYMLNYGIVGGVLKNSYFQGKTAAKLAKLVLKGTNINNIPVVIKSPNQTMFDYNEIKRYDIALSQLPKGSQLINEPQTFYYKYKEIIFIVLAVFIILLIYIMTLLTNIRKRMRAQKGLQAILESSTELLDVHSVEGFQKGIVKCLSKIIPINSQVSFYKVDDLKEIKSDSDLQTIAGRGDYQSNNSHKEKTCISDSIRGLVDKALKSKRSLVNKNQSVAVFDNKNLPINLIYAEGDKTFDDIDNNLLEMFTSNLAMSLDNLDKRKIEESLETARKIQMSMLPTGFEHFSNQHPIEIHAYLSAAKEVGGDLYDFFVKDTNKLFITVGDVSDKGVPAALFMAVAKTLIRSIAERTTDPAEILFKVNNELCINNEESMFVTLVLGVLDLNSGLLKYSNAGHTPCYLLSPNGEVEKIEAEAALPLGVFEDVDFITEELNLNAKQGILLYSDGVTEAMNADLEMYDEPRLEDALRKSVRQSAEKINLNIIDDLNSFVLDAQQSDDITLLFLKNKSINTNNPPSK